MRALRTWLSAYAILWFSARVFAQAPPLTAEFPVNTYTTGLQAFPSVALGPAGNFVVAWNSYGQDGSKYGIFGQRYDGLGNTIGSEFQVNTYTTGNQRHPSVGIDATGNFVVVWQSKDQDGSEYAVRGQRYDSSGAKAGSEFQANTYTPGDQSHPKVAVNGDGSFIVVWQDSDRDLSGFAVYGQRFNASGAKVGSDFQVNTTTGNQQRYPSIAADAGGNFAVVWQSLGQDGSGEGIFGQRFDRFASRVGVEFQVNTYTVGHQEYPSIATDPRGNFVVAWQDYPLFAGKYGIYAQRFNSGSERVGPEFPVAESFTTLELARPTVAVDGRGNIVVAWHGFGGGGTVLPKGIFSQRYDRGGVPDGYAFQVNTFTSGGLVYPAIATNPAGDFVVAWSSDPQDGSSFGIFARRRNISPASLQADAHPSHAGPGSTSDSNGVLESGEIVMVEPSWRIAMGGGAIPVALSGTGSDIYGPLLGSYSLNDTSADYGLTLPGSTGNCYDGTIGHDCYVVDLSSANHVGTTHCDAGFDETVSSGGLKHWKLHVGDSFSDVARSRTFYRKIETMLHTGITSGCTTTSYCPDTLVSRDQMSIFIAKVIAGSGELVPSTGTVGGNAYNCASGGHSLFSDVAPTDSFCKHVHYLSAQNVALGCNASQYCPTLPVTREAMASFIAKAIIAPQGGPGVPITYSDPGTSRSYSCNVGAPSIHFTDVPASNTFCKHIHYLWAKGIIDGCSGTQYCPSASVARDAMAKFIANGFGLQLYGP